MAPLLHALSLAGALAASSIASSSTSTSMALVASSSSLSAPSANAWTPPPRVSRPYPPPSSEEITGYIVYTNSEGQDVVCFVAGLDGDLDCEPQYVEPPRWTWTHWTQSAKSLFTGTFGLLGDAVYRGLEHLSGHDREE